MATPDRTTLKVAIDALMSSLRSGLQADPPTAAKPFRKIDEGEARPANLARPFMAVRLVKTEPLDTTEGDKMLLVNMEMRMVLDVISDNPHGPLLDTVAAVEDHFDNLQINETAIVEGADGFDDREWFFTYPAGSSGSQTAQASCQQSFIVRVQRASNRIP